MPTTYLPLVVLLDDAYSGIVYLLEFRNGVVCGTIVNDYILEVIEGLTQHTANRLLYVVSRIVDCCDY